MAIPRDEITARRKAVLADWISWGHDEGRIRELVKQGPLIEPKPEKEPNEIRRKNRQKSS
jgi:hypothetical protein